GLALLADDGVLARLVERGARSRFEDRQGLARVAPREPHEVRGSVLVELDRAGKTALVGDRAGDQERDVVGGQRLERERERTRQERGVDREARVLGGRRDERDPTVLDARQERVLL